MSEQKISYQVAVHKAGLSLAQGESVAQFTQALREAGQTYVMQKFNVPVGKADVYMMEVFSSAAVFEIYRYRDPSVAQKNRQKFYAVKYARKTDGSFEFAETKEVERAVVYREKTNMMPTTKAVEAAPGWVDVGKSIWNGVL